jgi:hypothetical protein
MKTEDFMFSPLCCNFGTPHNIEKSPGGELCLYLRDPGGPRARARPSAGQFRGLPPSRHNRWN